jgi:hypothetical protein
VPRPDPDRSSCPAPRRFRGRSAAALGAITAAVLAAGMTLTAGVAAAAPGPVTDAAIAGSCDAAGTWCHSGAAAVVTDARANAGTGYLRLDTPTAGDKAYVFNRDYSGKPLSALTTLSYETYLEQVGSGDPRQAPTLNIEVTTTKPGPDGVTPLGFTTLVWEPVYSDTAVTAGNWQTWAPSASKGWWASKDITSTGTPNKFGFNSYTATFADVQAALGSSTTILQVGINQGSGATALRAGADLLTIGGTSGTNTYDFDNPAAPPAGPARADLAVTLSITGTVAPGASTVATLTVHNNGPAAAKNIATGVTLPNGLRITAAPGGIAGRDGHSVAYLTANLGSGASATYQVTVAADRTAHGSQTLKAATYAQTADPKLINNAAVATTTVR